MRIIDEPDLQVPPSLGLEDVSPSGQESGEGMSHLYQTCLKFSLRFHILREEVMRDVVHFEERFPGQRAALEHGAQLELVAAQPEPHGGVGVGEVGRGPQSRGLHPRTAAVPVTDSPHCSRSPRYLSSWNCVLNISNVSLPSQV